MRKHLPIAFLLAASLTFGALSVSDYGESWDERDVHRYSEYAIRAYQNLLHYEKLPEIDPILKLYGPSYFMVVNVLARLLVTIHPAWPLTVAWHFLYFLTFVLGALALYSLCARWLSLPAAFGATVLFMSQPLLWGHAFINPKDTPFMALFTVTIYLGLRMIDGDETNRLSKWRLVLAAISLGAVSSFRVVGPLAGLIVMGFAIQKLGVRAIPPVAAYLGIAALTAYLTWPYLWPAPLSHMWESARTMVAFPWPGELLFRNQYYNTSQIPRDYFPTLLGIQLTEPALLLAAAGLAASALWRGGKVGLAPLALFGVWFVIPTAFVVINHSPLYDNARQLYFLLPPIFVLAGVGLDWLYSYVPRTAARAAILGLAMLPGLVGIVDLHPYSYVYYNSLVGGTAGAYRHYEMDYLATSFKEIADHLNSSANRGANVLEYGGPPFLLQHHLRSEIEVYVPESGSTVRYQYLVFLNRFDLDLSQEVCPDSETIYSVGRRGAVFAILKEVPRHAVCP